MELTRPLVLHLLVALIAYASLARAETTGVTEAISEEQLKVHEECRNADYKKYVKCLMRPKRHHHAHVDELPETDPVHCLKMCRAKCTASEQDCDKKCSHCTKRTKHKHQIITEYETSCEWGDCNNGGGDGGSKTTNITTNIDINNIVSGYPPVPPNGNGTNFTVYMPSLPLVPQLSMVPQITYGMGGCTVYTQWLCFQQTGAQPPVRQPDCSVCGNPLLHYRCDVTFCYSGHVTGGGTPCKSPGCVGGST